MTTRSSTIPARSDFHSDPQQVHYFIDGSREIMTRLVFEKLDFGWWRQFDVKAA
jgi:hypothetical protein